MSEKTITTLDELNKILAGISLGIDRLTADNEALRAKCAEMSIYIKHKAICAIWEPSGDEPEKECDCGLSEVLLGNAGQALLDRLEKLERLRDKVEGFKDHGSAKNGTHAGIMFEALAACEPKDK